MCSRSELTCYMVMVRMFISRLPGYVDDVTMVWMDVLHVASWRGMAEPLIYRDLSHRFGSALGKVSIDPCSLGFAVL